MNYWTGKNILVIGAARQGLAATRFLSRNGAKVTLNDGKKSSQLDEVINSLDDPSIKFHFGSHPLSLLNEKDAICVSGGVPLDIPLIKEARTKGIPITNDAQIFLDQITANVIGITGSAGKTTTTTLIGEIAKSATQPPENVWVGGNIGNPLIDQVDQMSDNDWVVMELSSFQLELIKKSPNIALVTNITPNHLDRHKTMEKYVDAKANILAFQGPSDIAILNRDDPNAYALRGRVKGRLLTFGSSKPDANHCNTFIENGMIKYFDGKFSHAIMSLDEIKLKGKHYHLNILAACAVGMAADFPVESIAEGIRNVKSIAHRLELVLTRNGISWVNDSIATAPERVIAALDAIDGPLVLLLGGRDKNLPWENLAEKIAIRQPKLILFGEAGEMIENILRKEIYCGRSCQIDRFNNFNDAVRHASKIAIPGESVLLSPGGTSYDAFVDFEERGNLFREIVENFA
jgi:UDP-N-acetylmuramoylalanine--D-glutamate ligase